MTARLDTQCHVLQIAVPHARVEVQLFDGSGRLPAA